MSTSSAGTWQDSTADSSRPASNVTRFSRALSANAIVERNGQKDEIPQIVYYQKGVGTGLGDKYWVVRVAGLGLSANVRAAYGFLVDNYNEGDKIYFFGFSRGAYTARAVAGLVCQWGLLTRRGMDNFPTVYKDFYQTKADDYTPEQRRSLGFRDPLPRFTVEIIGVWDTVAFHQTWLGGWVGEQLEFRNTMLSENVRYAFHALALDEERTAYQPTLWNLPKKSEGQELLQVWFSGVHTDVGGGGDDPRLANITLAWMIAQCMKDEQLSFDIEGYLFDLPPGPMVHEIEPWGTRLGKTETWGFTRSLEGVLGGVSIRTPLAYQPIDSGITHEAIHKSIDDRNLAGAGKWPCSALRARKDADSWFLTDGGVILETPLLEMEEYMKGRIRTVHVDQQD
ncbi:hypothetical protein ANOM_009977 [Aspergillus nomiae NRRL 13137]|uniref:T6SS Phospholipase effector Tle1-like catalytic domain-containing protein n=1 Tax=Aspergillus nomiae NRRL (strain ATCC 15546 / NRRL 13137 / CBS 260.88 / M93) TaxID=1509407 RepID=A0A0L1ISM7_ASPN3|nr:uncharacterized protein ANOM_009977 [Aspergillus nomiae NRRL 13137]KNG82213.1 hypothetical protein ANOM_009977 [Aspergillus nomiae NRRL 13137]